MTDPVDVGGGVTRVVKRPVGNSASVPLTPALSDTFERLVSLGWQWETVAGGGARIYDHTDEDLPSGVGPDIERYGPLPSAIRYYAQMPNVGVDAAVRMILPSGQENAGATTFVLAADINFYTGLAVRFDSVESQLLLGRMNGPTLFEPFDADKLSVADTIEGVAAYRVVFDADADTLAVYRGDKSKPSLKWTDTAHEMPQGNGFMYSGFSFLPSVTGTGPQITGWEVTADA